jgi:hypothetical protein
MAWLRSVYIRKFDIVHMVPEATSAELGEAGCSTAPRCPMSNQSCSTRQLRPSLTVSSVGRRSLRAIFLYERKIHDNDIKIKLDTVVLPVILKFLVAFPDDINVLSSCRL